MSEIEGSSFEPRNPIELAADAAMDAAEIALSQAGGELEKMFVILDAKEGSLDSGKDRVAAARGVEDGLELFTLLIEHMSAAGRQLGLDVQVHPLRRG